MANEKHLKILKQGVEVWNQWRKDNSDVKPDLRKMVLIDVDLRGVDLRDVDLTDADLTDADLGGADLTGAYLGDAKLGGTDLTGANLIGARLGDADLTGADLRGTDLSGSYLPGARLGGAYLACADLRGADLRGADLGGADLRGADLRGADLQLTNLTYTNLSNTTITGANLYGTAKDDWIIDGVKCDWVYWEEGGKDRTPKDREFRPGEFEELYKQLPTFEYIFEHGITLIDIAMINQIVNDITELHSDWELKIDGFHSRGQPHATFTIREKDLITQAFSQIKTKYEETLNRLKGQYEESNRILSEVVKELTNKPQLMITGDIIMGNKRIGRDNIEISGQAQVNQLTTGDSGNDPSDSTE